MRRLLSILPIILISIASFSQDGVFTRVIAKQTVFIRDRWIDSVRNDTAGWLGRTRSIGTLDAIYKFVQGRVNAIGTVTNVSLTTNQGLSAVVLNPTTTPDIIITLGDLTGVTSINGLIITPNTGIVTTGIWNGAVIGTAYGGTPTAGTTGQALVKNSNTDFDYSWVTISASGEVNTASNLGGGLPNFDSKLASDLQFNSFSSSDFNLINNVFYIDYVNGQAASGLNNGFLSSGDWTNFNNKLSSIDTSNITNFYLKVRSLLSAGSGISYDNATGIISATGSGGTVTSVAALTLGTTGTDLSSSVANGTTTPVITLNVPTASASNRGALSAADWSTFNSKLSSVDTTNITNFSGKVRSLFSGTAPIVFTAGVISITQSTTSTNGYLSSTDWNTFNGKESALTFSTGLTRTTNTITNDLATGISGGQSVIGGTGASENLTLMSTSNATKGFINFSTNASTSSVYDVTNKFLGIATNAPTHSITFGSTATGSAYYNTSDQTTNYERTRLYWSSNNFIISTESGGSGAIRNLTLIGKNKSFAIGSDLLTGQYNLGTHSTAVTNISIVGTSTTTTAASGVLNEIAILPTINQTSTAGYRGLWISPLETATGSGIKYLIDAGTNSSAAGAGTHTSKFVVDNSGNIITSAVNTYSSGGYDVLVRNQTSGRFEGTTITPGSGTVTTVSVVTANGVSGSVATATTTPAITLTLGAITPTTVNGNTFTTGTYTLTGVAGKTLTFNNSITLTATDGSTLAIGTGGTLGTNAYTSTAYAPIASPTFTGTVTIPTPFTLGAVSVLPTGTELNFVDGVTSAIQTQLDSKAPLASPTFTTSITGSYLTASQILITDGSKNIVSAAVATYPSLTELTYVKGVTSAIQTQLDAKQPQLNGTGFVKATGTTISYDNSTYLTTASAATSYIQNQIAGAQSSSNFHVSGRSAIGAFSDANTQLYVSETVAGAYVDNKRAIFGEVLATFNTTSGALSSFGVVGQSNSTRSSGANNLTNTGIYGSASGGQLNYAAYFNLGDIVMNSLPNQTTPDRIITQISSTKVLGYVTLGTNLSISAGVLNAAGGSLTVGTSTIASGTTTRILYDNAGVLGEYTITGNGTVVAMQTSPVFTTPSLGVATATSINKVAITAPATSATLTIADGKTLTISNTITFTATDGSTLAIGTGGTLGTNAYTSTAYAPLASPTFTGTVTIPTPFTLGAVSVLPTGTELNFVDGVTSAIQTQIDGKQPLDADLTTIAGLTATTNNFIVSVGSAWASRTPAQVNAILPVFTTALNGIVPLSGSAVGNFLRDDGTWAAASGGGGTTNNVTLTARLATAAALPSNTYLLGVLTAVSLGALTVDGVAVATNDLVLVKNESTGANNGLYTVTNAGSAGVAYVLTRHSSMDVTGEFVGAIVPIASEGTANKNTNWRNTNATAPTVGTTAITFEVQYLGAATATSINKLTITAPATSSILTIVDGSSLITSGAFALTLTSTATSNATIPAGTNTLYSTKSASITSAQLLASLTNATGTAFAVFSADPALTGVPTAPTAAVATNTTQLATTAFVQAAAGVDASQLQLMQALGSPALAMTLGVRLLSSGNFTLTDGQLYITAVYLKTAATITGVQFMPGNTGAYTADNYNGVGLYSVSGGTYTLVASTTDDGNLWKGTLNTTITKAFSSTYAAAAGVYYIAFLWNSSATTTAPALLGSTASGSAATTFSLTNSNKLSAVLNSQTTLPSSTTGAAVAATGISVGIILY